MFCHQCGKQIKDEAKFCPYCGAQQKAAEPAGTAQQQPAAQQPVTQQQPAAQAHAGWRPEPEKLPEVKRQEEPKGGKKRGCLPIVIAVLAVALIAVATAAVLLFGFTGKGRDSDPVSVTAEKDKDRDEDETDDADEADGEGEADSESEANGEGEPGSGDEADDETLSEEEQKAANEAESRFDVLRGRTFDAATESEKQLIESYWSKTEDCLTDRLYEEAELAMDRWENLIDAIDGSSQYEMEVEQVDVSEFPRVKVYVRIQDKLTMLTVDALTTEGFSVYEQVDGLGNYAKRDILRAVQLNNAESLNLAVVADVSGSMDGSPIREAKAVMSEFIGSVQSAAGDRVSVISFADEVRIESAFTGDAGMAQSAVDRLTTYNNTALYDGLYVAVEQTAAQDGAKCVIAFTDGLDNISKCTPQIVAEKAARYNIPIYIIGIGGYLGNSDLEYITTQTGGFFRDVSEISSMADIYNEIFREKKEMYVVEYETAQEDQKDVARSLNINYVDETVAVREQYEYVPAVYMEVNVSMAQMFVNDFIIYDSDRRYVTSADLDRLTKEELRLARNEIYARRGRKFNDQMLQQYFNSKSWYHGSIAPASFNEAIFNDYERANAYYIADYERLKGYIR